MHPFRCSDNTRLPCIQIFLPSHRLLRSAGRQARDGISYTKTPIDGTLRYRHIDTQLAATAMPPTGPMHISPSAVPTAAYLGGIAYCISGPGWPCLTIFRLHVTTAHWLADVGTSTCELRLTARYKRFRCGARTERKYLLLVRKSGLPQWSPFVFLPLAALAAGPEQRSAASGRHAFLRPR